jgi:cardiolipin synthase A/B
MVNVFEAFFSNLRITSALFWLNFALAIACCVREILNSRTPQGSIAWLFSLLLLPFPSTILYLIFGWKFFDGYAQIRKADQMRIARPARAQDLKLIDVTSSGEWPVHTNVSQMPFMSGNAVDILVDGEATFASIFAGIAKAERYILVQFYTIRDDDLGRRLADALIEKAKVGVKVHVLYDDVGSNGLPLSYRKRLREAGVEIAGFNQRFKFMRFYGPTRLNYRNHRKIVVVDGHTAWTGGLNVAIDYLGLNKRFGPWRDTHVQVDGPAALACALIFREDWHWATGNPLEHDPPPIIKTPGEVPILVMGSGPADRLEECAIVFSETIARARERLWIATPYFVPDADMRTALFAAVMRGVDVRIMLPSIADHWTVFLASNSYADDMVRHGVGIYRYQSGFLHQKVVLMDDQIASIGSVNFDNRSFNINFEVTLWFPHAETIKKVESMLLTDFELCRKISQKEARTRPRFIHFVHQAARLLSPIL